MQKLKCLSILLCCSFVSAFAQQADSTAAQPADTTAQPAVTTTVSTPQPQTQSTPGPSKVYYGGTIGFSFGDYFRISLEPYVGYKVTPKFSLGGKIRYEYIEDKSYSEKLTASNYGGSIFTRYRLIPQIYAHGEYAYMSYKYKISNLESERQWVPFCCWEAGWCNARVPELHCMSKCYGMCCKMTTPPTIAAAHL